MNKLFLISLILSSFLNSANSEKCHCPEKVTILFENNYEKLFEFKNKIYKITKGDDRRDSIFMILDESSKKYIVINSNKRGFESDSEDEETLELMK